MWPNEGYTDTETATPDLNNLGMQYESDPRKGNHAIILKKVFIKTHDNKDFKVLSANEKSTAEAFDSIVAALLDASTPKYVRNGNEYDQVAFDEETFEIIPLTPASPSVS